VHIVSCSVDSASGVIDTGLSVVDAYSIGVVSMTTAGLTFKRNIGSGATALPGKINWNSAVSGDVFLLTVYGR
jgi:hypothetical protein